MKGTDLEDLIDRMDAPIPSDIVENGKKEVGNCLDEKGYPRDPESNTSKTFDRATAEVDEDHWEEDPYNKTISATWPEGWDRNGYTGDAGSLVVVDLGDEGGTEINYTPAEDAAPADESLHGYLAHLAGMLKDEGASTSRYSIRQRSGGNPEKVVQAYTLIDKALSSEEEIDEPVPDRVLEDFEL